MEFHQVLTTDFHKTGIPLNPVKMGLKRRSISMPKLFTKFKTEGSYDVTNISSVVPNNALECQERSQIIQVFSGRESNREIGMRITKFTSIEQPVYQDTMDSISFRTKKNKGLHAGDMKQTTARAGFSERLKGMFNSIFNLDKRSNFSAEFNSSLPLQRNTKAPESIRHSKSLPDLNQRVQPSKPFRRQKSLLFTWARKSKNRSRNKIHRQDSSSSMNRSSSCESSPDVSWNSKRNLFKKTSKSVDIPTRERCFTTNYDNSPSSSPSSYAEVSGSTNHVFFDKTPENSPKTSRKNALQKQDSQNSRKADNFLSKMLDDSLRNSPSILRKHLSRGKNDTTSHSHKIRKPLPRSLSESSDAHCRIGSEDLNDSMISNASIAAQRKRRIFASRKTKSVDKADHADGNFYEIFKNGSTNGTKSMQNTKQNFAEKQNEIIYNIIQRELAKKLCKKVFHAEKTTHWCRDISESIKGKIELITGGVFKIVVQVFIGAVEDNGITSATQCNLGPRTDNFTVASYRQDSLFAVASVLAIDFREISVPVKSFQNHLYSKIHTKNSTDEKNPGNVDVP